VDHDLPDCAADTARPFIRPLMALLAALTLVSTGCSNDRTDGRRVEQPEVTESRFLHVSPTGRAGATGTQENPFPTIGAAAAVTRPGDEVLIHDGVYRETIRPPRSGTKELPITYRADDGERPVVSANEVVTDWSDLGNGVFEAQLPVATMADGNPFTASLPGAGGAHVGRVFVDRTALVERVGPDASALAPGSFNVLDEGRRVQVALASGSPSDVTIEVSARGQLLAPSVDGLGWIQVRGLTFEGGSDRIPGAEQAGASPRQGVITTSNGHDWVIEGTTIRSARAVAIEIGSEPDVGADPSSTATDPSQPANHVIRGNRIIDAGTSAISGTDSAFTLIEGNVILGANRTGAGQDRPGAIAVRSFTRGVIRRNLIADTQGAPAIRSELGWQGAQVSGNVITGNGTAGPVAGILVEAGHGPLTVDHNVFVDAGVRVVDGAGVLSLNNLYVRSSVRWSSAAERQVPLVDDRTGRPTGQAPPTQVERNRSRGDVFVDSPVEPPPAGPEIGDDNTVSDALTIGTGGPVAATASTAVVSILVDTAPPGASVRMRIDLDEAWAATSVPPQLDGERQPDPVSESLPAVPGRDLLGRVVTQPAPAGPLSALRGGSSETLVRFPG